MVNKFDYINQLYKEYADKIKFSKMYDDVIVPSKRKGDAGYDIYAYLKEDYVIIEPHETYMVNTGLRVWVPDNHYMQLFERGSTGKLGIGQRAGVIDSNFTGEILVPITNHTQNRLVLCKPGVNLSSAAPYAFAYLKDVWDSYTIYYTDKAITQGVVLEIPYFEVEEITEEEMLSRNTERGEGMLGSSRK